MARHRLAWGRRPAVGAVPKAGSSVAQRSGRKRLRQHEEWSEQSKLCRLLDRRLDPACSDWTATDGVAASANSGRSRKLRGIKPGVPDVLVWYRGRTITIELKSRYGVCSTSQRERRERLLCAGVEWWECRSANAAMWALAASGVEFRVIIHKDGTIERWQRPELADWESPRRDPVESRPNAPEALARGRAAQHSDGESVNALRERVLLAAERRYETDFPASTRRDGELPGTPCCAPRQRSRPGDQLPSKTKFGP
jgi:hypothetical protein